MIIDGLKRIVGSAKVQLLATSAFGAVVTYAMTPGTVAEKQGLMKTMVVTLGALVGAVILGWAHEDAATNASPQNQTNIDSDVTNAPTAKNESPAIPPAAKPDPSVVSALTDAILAEIHRRNLVAKASRPAQPTGAA